MISSIRQFLERGKKSDPSIARSYALGASRIEVGRFTYGMETTTIRQWREGASLKVGSFCSIAVGVKIFLGGNHRVDWCTTFPFGHVFVKQLGGEEIRGHPQTKGDVVIGNDMWIGEGATILSGVTIGDGAVIAGNATVTRSVGAYEIWGGNPACLIRLRFAPDVAERLHALRWWDCSDEAVREMAPLLSQVPSEAGLAALEDIARRNT